LQASYFALSAQAFEPIRFIRSTKQSKHRIQSGRVRPVA